ncbi:hypothetical protein [Terrabacter sp. BE26]|uniref:hypothetical protein n=1 Tax=Terrabacter sp. BE26 TaxID=2898152 RepID=UPI0035BE1436
MSAIDPSGPGGPTRRGMPSGADETHVRAVPGEARAPARSRVRVTSPRTSAARTRSLSVASEIDEQTRLGEVYITSLMRSQLRLALVVLVVLAVTLGLLPLLFRTVPAVAEVQLLGVPLPWLLLTVTAFVEIILLGWFYVRRSERNEATFSDLLAGR